MSIMPCSATCFSADTAPASVSSRISARTRSGAVSATRSETKPPWLMPPTTARSMPRWSSSPMQSLAESQYVNG